MKKVIKKKKESIVEVWYSTSIISYCPCPYCKKMMIMLDKKDKAGKSALRKWKKIKLTKKKSN